MNDQQLIVAAANFLRRWYGSATRVLTAIDPDEGYIRTAGFGPSDDEALRAFLREWQGRRGVYVQVNRDLRPAAEISTKGKKEHIATAVALQLDMDTYKGEGDHDQALRSLTEELPAGIPGPPSVINSSGNGLQAFWLLRPPLRIDGDNERAVDVERCNRGLAAAFGGDSTTDVSRILRVPWTINLPNPAKRSLGLAPSLAKQIVFDSTRRYALGQFPAVDAAHRDHSALEAKLVMAMMPGWHTRRCARPWAAGPSCSRR